MYGLPADTVRKKFRTRIIRENSLNPVYGDEPFVFKKVVLPELASVRIAAYEENGKFLGHRVLPVIGLCPGYRHLTLRNELGQPIPLATLFLCIVVKDYVPDGLSDFAEALANPIKYQSDLEKRSQQLAVLQEDMEPSEDDGTGNCKHYRDCWLRKQTEVFFPLRPSNCHGQEGNQAVRNGVKQPKAPLEHRDDPSDQHGAINRSEHFRQQRGEWRRQFNRKSIANCRAHQDGHSAAHPTRHDLLQRGRRDCCRDAREDFRAQDDSGEA